MITFRLMKNCFKAIDRVYKRLMGRMDWLENKYRAQEKIIRALEQEIIKLRCRFKLKAGEPLKIFFICHRPALWSSLETVWRAFINDKRFDVTIVAIPNKKQLPKLGLSHEIYDDEGAWDFFKDFPGQVLKGYDESSRVWLDLQSLSPDFVFFQTPYDICRPQAYQSSTVSGHSFLGYVDYGLSLVSADIAKFSFPADFAANLTLCFAESEERKFFMENVIKTARNPRPAQVLVTGYPRLDDLEKKKTAESSAWRHARNKGLFRIIWTPRWSVKEGSCFFFDFKDKLFEYAEKNDGVELLFRPHPQTFLEFIAGGLMTEKDIASLKKCYVGARNSSIDNQAGYLDSFYSSDLLISDFSSIMGEYLLTERPVIYCHRTDTFSPFGRRLAEGFYWVHNWPELEKAINSLKAGHDPLLPKRQAIIQTEFYRSKSGAGSCIKDSVEAFFSGL